MTAGSIQPAAPSFTQFNPPGFPFMATPFAAELKGLANGQWPGAATWPPGVTGTGSPNATPGASTAPHWQADPSDPLLAPILQRQGSIQAQAMAGGAANDRPFALTDIFSRDQIEASLHARQHATQARLDSLGRAEDLPAILRHQSDRGGQTVMDSCRALALAGAPEHPEQADRLQRRLTAYLDAAKGEFEGTSPNWDSGAFRQLQKLERALEALLAKIGPQELTRQLQADLAPAMLEILSRKHPGACATTLLPKLTGCVNPEAFAIQQGNMRRYGNGLAALLREAEKLPYLLDEPAPSMPSVDTPKSTSAQPPSPTSPVWPQSPFVNNFNPVITVSPTNTVNPLISTAAKTGTPPVATSRTTADQSTQTSDVRSDQHHMRDMGVDTDGVETRESGTDPMGPDTQENIDAARNADVRLSTDSTFRTRTLPSRLHIALQDTHQRNHVATEESSNDTARTPRRFRHEVVMPLNAGMMKALQPGSRERFTLNGSSREGVLRQDVRIAQGAEVINDDRSPIVAGTLRKGYDPQNTPFVRVGPQPVSIRNLDHRGSPYTPGQTLTGSGSSSPASTPRTPLSPATSMTHDWHTPHPAPGRGTARPEIRASSGTGHGTRDPARVRADHLASRFQDMGSSARNPLVSSLPLPPVMGHSDVTSIQPSPPAYPGTLSRSARKDASRDDDTGGVRLPMFDSTLGTAVLRKLIAEQAVEAATMRRSNNAGTSVDSNRAGA